MNFNESWLVLENLEKYERVLKKIYLFLTSVDAFLFILMRSCRVGKILHESWIATEFGRKVLKNLKSGKVFHER